LCGIRPGDTVTMWGCGGVGLMAQKSGFLLAAERVIAIDSQLVRHQRPKAVRIHAPLCKQKPPPVLMPRRRSARTPSEARTPVRLRWCRSRGCPVHAVLGMLVSRPVSNSCFVRCTGW